MCGTYAACVLRMPYAAYDICTHILRTCHRTELITAAGCCSIRWLSCPCRLSAGCSSQPTTLHGVCFKIGNFLPVETCRLILAGMPTYNGKSPGMSSVSWSWNCSHRARFLARCSSVPFSSLASWGSSLARTQRTYFGFGNPLLACSSALRSIAWYLGLFNRCTYGASLNSSL